MEGRITMTIRLKEAAQRLLAAAGLLVGAASPTLAEDIYAQYCEPCPPVANPCPPPMVTDQPSETPTPMDADGQAPPNPVPADPAPIDLGADAPQVDLSPPPSNNALAQASRSQSNFAPNMIGDFFASGVPVTVDVATVPTTFFLPNPGGDIAGRPRVGDNNSAMPTDRVYFDYNLFHNTTLVAQDATGTVIDNGVDVDRYSYGLEKTFFGGLMSIEVRVPTAVTVSSDTIDGSPTDFNNFELGNILIAPKFLLRDNSRRSIAAGVGVALPTADDLVIIDSFGGTPLRVENESVHLIPYVAYLLKSSSDGFFGHAFVSVDTDLNGNSVFNLAGQTGTFNDQTLVSVDLSLGRWILEDYSCNARVNGVAWTTEVHYSATVNDADTVSLGPLDTLLLGDSSADLSLLNGTVGGHVQIGQTTLTAAYTVPLTSSDRTFDGEFRFFVNRNF